MKKVMIALLALAVLFSFAACDNSNGTPESSGEIARLYQAPTDNVTYLVGQVANLDDFTVMIQYTDGTSEKVESANLTLTQGNGQLKADSTLEVSYNLAPASAPVTTELKATIVPVTSIEVTYKGGNYDSYYDNVVGSVSYKGSEDTDADDIFHKSQYDVKAVYTLNGVETKKTLLADEYVVTALTDTTADKTDATATIKLDLNKDGNEDFAGSGEAYEDVAGTASNIVILADTLTGINAELATGKEFIAGAAKEASDLKSYFTFTGNYASGAVKTVSTEVTAATFDDSNFTQIAAAKDAYPTTGNVKVNFTVTGLTGQSAEFAVVPNYVEKFTVKAADVQAGASIVNALTVTPTWKATTTSDKSEETKLTYVVTPDVMPKEQAAGTQIPVTVSIQGQDVAAQTIMVKCVAASSGAGDGGDGGQ